MCAQRSCRGGLAWLCAQQHTEADTDAEKLIAGDAGRQVGDGEAHIVDTVLDHAEDVTVGLGAVVERGDEVLQRAAHVAGQLVEEGLGLFFGEGTHFGLSGSVLVSLRMCSVRYRSDCVGNWRALSDRIFHSRGAVAERWDAGASRCEKGWSSGRNPKTFGRSEGIPGFLLAQWPKPPLKSSRWSLFPLLAVPGPPIQSHRTSRNLSFSEDESISETNEAPPPKFSSKCCIFF